MIRKPTSTLPAAVLIAAAALLFAASRPAAAGGGGTKPATATATATVSASSASAAGTDDAKKIDRKVKVIVRKGDDGETSEVVISPDDAAGGDTHAYFVGEGGDVEALPDAPGEPHAFQWVTRTDDQPHGYLGALLTDLTPELRTHFGAPAEAGVMVGKVEPGSPAEAAGLRVGDVVTALDGESVATSGDVRRRVRALGDGDALALEVRRDGKRVNLSASVVQRAVPEVDARRFVWHQGDKPDAYEVDPKALDETIQRMSEKLSSPDFQGRLQHLQSAEGDLTKRIDELEAKLQDLERQLAESKAKNGG
jgi:membrane-associated protease RseP (regulator of RpoE activity)